MAPLFVLRGVGAKDHWGTRSLGKPERSHHPIVGEHAGTVDTVGPNDLIVEHHPLVGEALIRCVRQLTNLLNPLTPAGGGQRQVVLPAFKAEDLAPDASKDEARGAVQQRRVKHRVRCVHREVVWLEPRSILDGPDHRGQRIPRGQVQILNALCKHAR